MASDVERVALALCRQGKDDGSCKHACIGCVSEARYAMDETRRIDAEALRAKSDALWKESLETKDRDDGERALALSDAADWLLSRKEGE